VFVSNFFHNGQSQARSFGFSGDIGLEGSFEDLVWKTRAVVPNEQPNSPNAAVVVQWRIGAN